MNPAAKDQKHCNEITRQQVLGLRIPAVFSEYTESSHEYARGDTCLLNSLVKQAQEQNQADCPAQVGSLDEECVRRPLVLNPFASPVQRDHPIRLPNHSNGFFLFLNPPS